MNSAGNIMSATVRNNVRVSGHGSKAMVFAHGFGCDQNMWRYMAPPSRRTIASSCSITLALVVRLGGLRPGQVRHP
jgi:hypothetical protein